MLMPQDRKCAGVLFGLCAVLASCGGGDTCGDLSAFLIEYRIEKYSMQFSVFVPDNTISGESTRPLDPDIAINPLDFALRLNGVTDKLVRVENPKEWFRFSWLSEAQACSPATYQIPLQRLVNYQITSTASFGDGFPAGTDIKTLFLEERRTGPEAKWISQFLDGGITDDTIPPIQQTLRLSAMPADVDHVFTATIELDDGSYYQFVSPTVKFNLE